MIIDRNNNMVGVASHIREVGPHMHAFVEVGMDSGGYRYRECGICGTRTSTYPILEDAEKRAWLCGGSWDAAKSDVTKEPEAIQAPAPIIEPEAAPDTLEQQAAFEAATIQASADDDDDDDDAPVRRRGRPRKVQP